MTETPETPTPSLAARLERYGRGTPKMDGSEVVPLPKYRDRPGQVIAILPAPVVADLRAAAAQLRQLDRIKAAAGDDIEWSVALAVCRELAVRYPSWASDLNLTEALLRRISDALEADQ